LDNKNADKKIFMPKQFEFNTFIENLRSISRISGEFTLLWFFSNYFYNAGLASTSVSSSTVLSNTSSIFVYLVGLCLLDGIRFNIWKALMVLGSFFGIWIVAMADKQGGSDNG
tara:strand:- start:489 stop:827 length:339 start_codon:yes stop_codon:yes gene_type:complete